MGQANRKVEKKISDRLSGQIKAENEAKAKIAKDNLDRLARAIAPYVHDVIMVYSETHGDASHNPWSTTDPRLQESVLDAVKAVIEDPHTTPEESHIRWMQARTQAGWRWDAVKSVKDKTHPCLVPYAQLPPHQRLKDLIFIQCVKNCVVSGKMIQPGDLYYPLWKRIIEKETAVPEPPMTARELITRIEDLEDRVDRMREAARGFAGDYE